MSVNRNTLRMPFAEWLGKMAAAHLEQGARIVAIYAAAFDISGNDNLKEITGIKSDKTIWKLKKLLLDEGWVIVQGRTGGRGHGSTITPAFQETPVSFTDLSPKNPGKYYVGSDEETYVTQGRGLAETYVNKPMVSGVGVLPENPAKSTSEPETPVKNTDVSPSRTCATKESPSEIVNNNINTPFIPHDPEHCQPGNRAAMVNGKIILFNGCRAEWLAAFGSEKDLDLALIQAAGYVQPNNRMKSLEVQVNAQLAKMIRDRNEKDQRYSKAARDNQASKPQAGSHTPADAKKKFEAIVGKRS